MKNLKKALALAVFTGFIATFTTSCASNLYGCPGKDYGSFNARRHFQAPVAQDNHVIQAVSPQGTFSKLEMNTSK
ncbi:MAG: hypothetical protein GY810_28550 [Aureispira sp.]|nr:hypothetical protein [Aureispira sp.]